MDGRLQEAGLSLSANDITNEEKIEIIPITLDLS
jgi:hypothetical protein